MRPFVLSFVVLVVGVGHPLMASADWSGRSERGVDLMVLTEELKRAVPFLEGCDDTDGLITCRRLQGDFTDVEQAAMKTVIASHDSAIRAKQKVRQLQHRKDAEEKLKALGLTQEEVDALQEKE